MRGGLLHNDVLVKAVEDFALSRGALVRREEPTGPGRRAGFVDLLIIYRRYRIVCEIELTSARVGNDVKKALALEAAILLIAVPTSRVARSARAKLRRDGLMRRSRELTVLVTTLGQAIQQLSRTFGLLDSDECPRVQKSKTSKSPQQQGR